MTGRTFSGRFLGTVLYDHCTPPSNADVGALHPPPPRNAAFPKGDASSSEKTTTAPEGEGPVGDSASANPPLSTKDLEAVADLNQTATASEIMQGARPEEQALLHYLSDEETYLHDVAARLFEDATGLGVAIYSPAGAGDRLEIVRNGGQLWEEEFFVRQEELRILGLERVLGLTEGDATGSAEGGAAGEEQVQGLGAIRPPFQTGVGSAINLLYQGRHFEVLPYHGEEKKPEGGQPAQQEPPARTNQESIIGGTRIDEKPQDEGGQPAQQEPPARTNRESIIGGTRIDEKPQDEGGQPAQQEPVANQESMMGGIEDQESMIGGIADGSGEHDGMRIEEGSTPRVGSAVGGTGTVHGLQVDMWFYINMSSRTAETVNSFTESKTPPIVRCTLQQVNKTASCCRVHQRTMWGDGRGHGR